MRRLWPDSIAARTMLVLVAGLSMTHLLSTAVHPPGHERSAVLSSAHDLPAAGRHIAAMAALLDVTDPAQRFALAQSLSLPELPVQWSQDDSFPPEHQEGQENEALRSVMAPVFGPLPHERMHVLHRPRASLFSGAGSYLHPSPPSAFDGLRALLHPTPEPHPLQISVRLADHSWADFGVLIQPEETVWSWTSLLSFLIMGVGVALFSALATRAGSDGL